MSRATPLDLQTDEARAAPWLILLVVGMLLYRIAYVWTHDYSLFVDEAQYWLWSRDLQAGYYSKPPLVAWLIRASTMLLGDGELGVKLPALLAYPLASLGLYQLGRDMRDARTGLIAAALFLTMPGQALGGWVLSPDALLLAAWSWALWLFWRAQREPTRWSWWLWLGVAVGLGALAKYTMLVFVPLAGFVLWRMRDVQRVRGAGPWIAVGIVLLLLTPNIAWNIAHQFETVKHTAHLTRASQAGLHPMQMLEFIGAQWGLFGLMSFPLLLWLAWRERSTEARFLRPFALVYLAVMVSLALFTAANANWAITAYAAGSVWVALWFTRARARWLWLALALNALLHFGLLHYRDIGSRLGQPPSRSGKDLYARVLGWRELGQALQPLADAHGRLPILSNDRTLLAQLAYYVQPRPYPATALDDDGRINNQFEMDARARGLPAEVLWVEFVRGQSGSHGDAVDAADPAALLREYAPVQDLGLVRVQRRDGPPRIVHVVRMRRTSQETKP